MNTTQNTEYIIVMNNGCQAEESFYKMILTQVEDMIPGLTPGSPYTLKTLCGEDIWNLLSNGERVLAGKCMANIVKTKQLSLVATGTDCHNANQYALLMP